MVGGIIKEIVMKTKKIYLLITLLFCMSIGYADEIQDPNFEKYKEELRKLHLTLPDSGIQIVPRSEIELSLPKDYINESRRKHTLMQTKGYIKKYNPRAQQLFEFHHTGAMQIKQHENNYNPLSTHLRKSPNDLRLAFIPKKINHINMTGAAPIGAYLKGQGWNGDVQFFIKEEIGSCAYSEMSFLHGGVRLADDAVRYDINGKATLVEVSGNDRSGYVYKIKWFDNAFTQTLECASKTYHQSFTEKVIQFASEIDKS